MPPFKPTTAQDYARRLDRALDHIATHLDDELDLARLADVACFSPYHFARVFTAMAGEPPAAVVRRLRLHRASCDLIHTGNAVADVAARAGYTSVAAFTRAFTEHFGLPPASYRRRGRLVPLSPASEEDMTMTYTVEIADLAPVRVAAIRHVGPYTDIGSAFQRLYIWGTSRGLMTPATRTIGIYHDDPTSTKEEALRSDACMTVGPDVDGDETVSIVDIPGGHHATMIHKGPYAELVGAYKWLYGTWLPSSGQEPADRPCLEIYLNNPQNVPPEEWLTQICMPLAA